MARTISFSVLLCITLLCFSGCKKEPIDDEITKETVKKPEPLVLNDDYVYTLPVVFHVLYKDKNDEKQYVTAQKLATIIQYVNELYKGNIYGTSENIKVRFTLADTNEVGQKLTTPGVEYVHWNEDYPIDVIDFMSDDTKKNVKYLWDPNKYINVMLFQFKEDDEDGTTLGISHLPFKSAGNATLKGLERATHNHLTKENLKYPFCASINSLFIDEVSKRYNDRTTYRRTRDFNPSDIVCTIAHELGHYLGLYHVFTENRNGFNSNACGDTDYCLDTPSYNKTEYDSTIKHHVGKWSIEEYNDLFYRTNCQGKRFQAVNIMDYAFNDPYQFTHDQKYRMRQVLYYSPLIPGPKKEITGSRSITPNTPLDLPIRFVVDKINVKTKKFEVKENN